MCIDTMLLMDMRVQFTTCYFDDDTLVSKKALIEHR